MRLKAPWESRPILEVISDLKIFNWRTIDARGNRTNEGGVSDGFGSWPLSEECNKEAFKVRRTQEYRFQDLINLAEAITRSRHLTKVDLSGNFLCFPRGTQLLALAVKGSNVSTLSLAGTGLKDRELGWFASVLKESSIQSLDLSQNPLEVQGLQLLAEGLKSSKVTDLNLSESRSAGPGLYFDVRPVAAVLRETSIRSLDLFKSPLEAWVGRALVEGLRASSVTALNLRETRLGNKGAMALLAILNQTSLQSLNLACNQIHVLTQAEGLKGSHLTDLDLYGNRVGDRGVRALVAGFRESSLRSLSLASNEIGLNGALAIAGGLKVSKLTSLNLQSNRLQDEAVKILAAALRGSLLQSLDLSFMRVGLAGGEALLAGLSGSPVAYLRASLDAVPDEIRRKIEEAVQENRIRHLVLNMSVRQSENAFHLTFYTMGGSEVIIPAWYPDGPVQDLPFAVLSAMRSSGLAVVPARNLRIMLPRNMGRLDVGPTAASLAQQLETPAAASEEVSASASKMPLGGTS